MVCEQQINKIDKLCKKYGFSYRAFPQTGNILIETPLDQYLIKILQTKKRYNICLMHKNRLHNTSKYHEQRKFSKIGQAIDSIARHRDMKKVYQNANAII